MTFALASLVTLGLLVSQDESPAPAEANLAQVSNEAELPVWRPIESPRQLTRQLEALVEFYPNWVDLRQLQADQEATPIQLLVLGERELGDPSKRPGLLLLPELASTDRRGAATLVAVARQLCRELEGERPISSLLRQSTIYVIPAPLAEIFASEDEAPVSRSVEFSRNFPGDWRPERNGSAGPYPLSEPESRALADFMHWRSNLAACLEVSNASPFLSGDESILSAEDSRYSGHLTEVLSDLGAEEPVVFGLDVLAAGAGSLRRYADRVLGLWVFLEAPSNAAVADAFRSSEVLLAESTVIATQTLSDRIVGLALTLPRLQLGQVEVEQLAEDLWRVDIPVKNSGGFSTGARYRAEPSAHARLEIEGAEFAATMVRGANREAFVPLPSRGNRVDLGHLAGGETRVLRAIVRGAAEASLLIRVRASRGGTDTTSVDL